MKATSPLLHPLFEGLQEEARTLVRDFLASGEHPVSIVKEAIIPAVEASSHALKSGSLKVGALPALGSALLAAMEERAEPLKMAGLSLHFRVGKACDDVFDLWGTEIAGAFEGAGCETSRSSELNRCQVVRNNDWLTASEFWRDGWPAESILNSSPRVMA